LAKTRLAQAFTLAAALVTFIGIYAFIFPSPSPSTTQDNLGAMCCLVTISVYAAPLSSVLRALQLQSSKPISLFFALVGTLNSVLWSGYGLLTNDAWVYVPSVIGAVLSLAQAAVFFWFAVVVRRGGGGAGKEGGREGGAGKRPSLSEFLLLGTGEGGKEGGAALL
jgi:solute carrier family 50 protein (sugar transporter)